MPLAAIGDLLRRQAEETPAVTLSRVEGLEFAVVAVVLVGGEVALASFSVAGRPLAVSPKGISCGA